MFISLQIAFPKSDCSSHSDLGVLGASVVELEFRYAPAPNALRRQSKASLAIPENGLPWIVHRNAQVYDDWPSALVVT